MLWSEFKSKVLEFLPLDAVRAGAGTLVANLTKSGALDLAGNYPGFGTVSELRLAAADGTRVQNALQFELDAGTWVSEVRVASLFSEEHDIEGESADAAYRDSWQGVVDLRPWKDRLAAIRGDCGVGSYNKDTGELLAPFFVDGEQELVVWTVSRAADFADGDTVSFNIRDAECVAAYVQAHIARSIDKNPRLADAHETRFRQLRRDRYLELKGD